MSVSTSPPIAPAGIDPARSHPGGTDRQHSVRWWILAVLGLAQLMVVLDATVVNIALPSAQRALHFSDADRQWVVTAYALSFGSLLLLGGRLADLVGRRRVFLVGLVGFAAASAVGGASTSFGMLVVARAVQGMFGALLAPAGLSLLNTTFTDSGERAKAFGIYGAIAGAGSAVGLILGGALTEYLSWRWCMFINVGFAAVAFLGGIALLAKVTVDAHDPIDVIGAIAVTVGLFLVVYGFSHAETGGWGSDITVGSLVAGAVLLVAFVIRQQHAAHPLLPLRVVLDRNRGGSYIALLLSSAGMFGVFLFLTYYLQETLGYSALKSGLAFLPMTGSIIVVASLASQILPMRVGPKLIIAPGLAIAAVGMFMLRGIGVDSSYVSAVLPGTVVFGAGLGLTFSSAMSVATLGVASADSGVAAAMVNTGQQVGGSIGTSLLNTIAATAVTDYLTTHGHTAAATAAAAVHSYTVIFAVCAGILALAAVLSGLLLRREVPEIDPNAEALVVA